MLLLLMPGLLHANASSRTDCSGSCSVRAPNSMHRVLLGGNIPSLSRRSVLRAFEAVLCIILMPSALGVRRLEKCVSSLSRASRLATGGDAMSTRSLRPVKKIDSISQVRTEIIVAVISTPSLPSSLLLSRKAEYHMALASHRGDGAL